MGAVGIRKTYNAKLHGKNGGGTNENLLIKSQTKTLNLDKAVLRLIVPGKKFVDLSLQHVILFLQLDILLVFFRYRVTT